MVKLSLIWVQKCCIIAYHWKQWLLCVCFDRVHAKTHSNTSWHFASC